MFITSKHGTIFFEGSVDVGVRVSVGLGCGSEGQSRVGQAAIPPSVDIIWDWGLPTDGRKAQLLCLSKQF